MSILPFPSKKRPNKQPNQKPDVNSLVEAALKNSCYDKSKDPAYIAFCKKLDDAGK